MFRIDRKALLYGISAMSCSMLHCIFVSFYIDYFVRQNIMSGAAEAEANNVNNNADGDRLLLGGNDGGASSSSSHHSSASAAATLNWFIVGQVVYAVWNALNDLGFGWLSDTSYAKVKRLVVGGGGGTRSSSRPAGEGIPFLPYTSPSSADRESRRLFSVRLIYAAKAALRRAARTAGQFVPSFISRNSRAILSRRRLSRVAVGGPLWAAAFAFLWYPAPFLRNISPALELSVKMIIYDFLGEKGVLCFLLVLLVWRKGNV